MKKGTPSINAILLLSIFFISFLVRLIWIWFVPTLPVSDFLAYQRAAESIASGKMYWVSEHIWPAGYPLLLAGIYALIGSHRIITAKLLNAIFGAIVAVLIAYITGYLFENKAVGFLSGMLTGLWPQYVLYSSVLASENAGILFLVLASFFVILYFQNKKLTNAFLSGLSLSLAALIRPSF